MVRYENGQPPSKANANLIRAAAHTAFMRECLERDGEVHPARAARERGEGHIRDGHIRRQGGDHGYQRDVHAHARAGDPEREERPRSWRRCRGFAARRRSGATKRACWSMTMSIPLIAERKGRSFREVDGSEKKLAEIRGAIRQARALRAFPCGEGRMMKADPGAFSEEEFAGEFQSIAKHLVLESRCAPSAHPRAVLLGGQSGAGKTALHELCVKGFKDGHRHRRRRVPLTPSTLRRAGRPVRTRGGGSTAAWAGQDGRGAGQSSVIRPLQPRHRRNAAHLAGAAGHGRGERLSRRGAHGRQARDIARQLPDSLPSSRAWPARRRVRPIPPITTRSLPTSSRTWASWKARARSTRSGSTRAKESCCTRLRGTRAAPTDVLEAVLFGPWTPTEREHYEFLEAKLASLQGGASLPSGAALEPRTGRRCTRLAARGAEGRPEPPRGRPELRRGSPVSHTEVSGGRPCVVPYLVTCR